MNSYPSTYPLAAMRRPTSFLAAVIAAFSAGQAWAEEPSQILPDTVVSASLVPTSSAAVGSSVTVITGEELERKQTRLVSDILREVPGLSVTRSGNVGTLTAVRIRGAEANHTLVIIDGVEMNDPSSSAQYDFSTLHAADIERIEVLRGPQSSIYGSDALGGVVNIITKKGKGAPQVNLSAEGGSFNTAQAAASIRGGAEKYHYSLGVSGFQTQGESIALESNGATEEDGSKNFTLNLKAGFEPVENLEIEVFGRHLIDRTDNDPQPSAAGIIVVTDDDRETHRVQTTGRIRAKYSMFDDSWEHILTASKHIDGSDSLTNDRVTFVSDGDKIRYAYQTNYFFETPEVAEATHRVTFLAEQENEYSETGSNIQSLTQREITNSGYVFEYGLDLWDRLFLTGAVRHDDNDIFKDATTARATLAYLHKETGTRLHASYGEGVKNPTLSELFGSTATYTGNPNLRPESNEAWDVGIEQSFLDDRVVADITYFKSEVTDLITGSGNTSINNEGISKIDGAEFSITAELIDNLLFTGSYTYTLANDANGKRLVRRAKHIASANLSYQFLDGRAIVDLGVDYTGRRRDNQFSNNYATTTEITLGEYWLVNVAGSYELRDNLTLFARVENALDEEYEEVFSYGSVGLAAYAGIRTSFGL